MNSRSISLSVHLLLCALPSLTAAEPDFSPRPEERQLPKRMHSEMAERPRIRVGQSEGDIVGRDNRVLQAAIEYVAALGGGTVEIGEGEYQMHDSLHLRSFVSVRGVPGKTVLKKAAGVVSPLALDGDYGEEQVTLLRAEGFDVGDGLAIWDSRSGGFHTTVARITGKNGATVSLSQPLNADCMIGNGAQAATVFPVVSGVEIEGVEIDHLIIDGTKEENVALNGCRGAGIYLYRGFGTVIRNCVVRRYNGDGISFQQSNDVQVLDCLSEENAALGIHPGSGSQRPRVFRCTARFNGEDGLFLCWRVRHGMFEENLLEQNGRFGISIGHKDTDNLLRGNTVLSNALNGIFFRNESLGMGGHRNRLEENRIENNGVKQSSAAIRVRGETRDLHFKDNVIRDTRPDGLQTQTIGIELEEKVGRVTLAGNQIEASTPLKDKRWREVHVSSAAELREAMAQVTPGTRVLIAPGEYPGGFHFPNLQGEEHAPIIVAAADPAHPPLFKGNAGGWQLTDPSWIELHHLAFEGQTGNGLNIDDGGSFDTPAHHVTLRNIQVRNIGPKGNNDAIKLSGVVDFRIEECALENWGTGGGSGIDMVGCHRGMIASNRFRHTDTTGSTGIQCKGGTSAIEIRGNHFEDAGGRAINIGGSTGLSFFRPPLQPGREHFEARDILVEGNTFIGAGAPVAFVGVDGAVVRFNTFYRPRRWALRILQETRDPGFVASRNGVFTDNLVVFNSAEWAEGGVNIGSGTAPETFQFARNWWYALDRPDRSRPQLPSEETSGVYGRDPRLIDTDSGLPRLGPDSPARAVGAEAAPERN